MMIRRALLSATCAIAALAGTASSAMADDFAPPSWRGAPLTTVQGWEFLSPGAPTPADDPFVPLVVGDGGTFFGPSTGPVAEFFDMAWSPGDGDGGWVPTGLAPGFILFHVPNWIDFEPIKWIHMQVVFLGDPGSPPVVSAIDGIDNVVGPVGGAPLSAPMYGPLGMGYFGYVQDFIIQPNPNWERIQLYVPNDILIDQVVIDTISFPEPASMAMLALGGLVMLARRRR